MGKKMKLLPSLLKRTQLKKYSSSSSWPWPSCHQPKTLSFRANDNDIFKNINSAYLDPTTTMEEVLEMSSESFFTVSPDSASFSTNASDEDSTTRRGGQDSIETVIRGLRSDRLFFEADETNSILESKSTAETGDGEGATTATALAAFKDSVVLSMDSKDPYVDFRKSMEEMVEAHGVKDWDGLEELLCWYLKVNGKTNHGYIVGAFVDLLVALALASSSASAEASTSSTTSSSSSSYSPLSFYSSSMSSSCSTRCVSCLEAEEDVVTTTTTPTSSSLSSLEQVKEEIKREDEALSSSSSN